MSEMFVYEVELRDVKTKRIRFVECMGNSLEDARRFAQGLFGYGYEVVR